MVQRSGFIRAALKLYGIFRKGSTVPEIVTGKIQGSCKFGRHSRLRSELVENDRKMITASIRKSRSLELSIPAKLAICSARKTSFATHERIFHLSFKSIAHYRSRKVDPQPGLSFRHFYRFLCLRAQIAY